MKRRNYIKPSKKELERWVKLTSLSTIAWRLCGNGCRIDQIRKWCEEYDIYIPPPKPKKPNQKELLDILNNGQKIDAIAIIFEVKVKTIQRWMIKFRIRRRNDSIDKSPRFEQFGKPVSTR